MFISLSLSLDPSKMILTKGLRNAKGVSTVLGTMEFGRRASLEESTAMVKLFKEKNYNELDTAAMYSGGQTEEYLGEMKENWESTNVMHKFRKLLPVYIAL